MFPRRQLSTPGVASRLGSEIQRMGASLLYRGELLSARKGSNRWRLTTAQREVEARVVITCAGLQSDRVARLIASRTKYQVVPFEGKYIRLSSRRSGLIRGLSTRPPSRSSISWCPFHSAD